MKGPETRLRKRIQEALKEAFPGSVWRKIHGGPMQNVGIGDLLGCVKGIYCNLEVKLPGGHASPAQKLEILAVRRAGGIAGVVTNPGQAVYALTEALLRKGVTL